MESSTEAAPTGSSASTFSQVVFMGIPHSYPPSTHVTCCYILNAAFQPNPRDWVGIFKVGWSTTKDYHTFVWVEPCLDVVGEQTARQAVFKDYYLPKDEIEFYQFCYIDSTGQVRGASTPFCFRNPTEQSMESSPDDDLLVITTQEQVEQSVREKAELQKELNQFMEENETLKKALENQQQEAASLKGQNEQKEKENCQLLRELDQFKQQNEKLQHNLQQQLIETDRIKVCCQATCENLNPVLQYEEMLIQMTKQMEIQQQSAAEQIKTSQSLSSEATFRQNEAHLQEKYDRAVTKINQLKGERDELRGVVEAQSDEIASLSSKIREAEREVFKMKDSVQLLEVDLQSSEKEKEGLAAELQRLQSLTHNMDSMKRENQELCRRLSQQETLQSSDPSDDMRVQCQSLDCQLQEARLKLAAEKEESKNAKRRVEFLEIELTRVREQVDSAVISSAEIQRKCNKQELQLREAHEMILDGKVAFDDKEQMMTLLNQEKDELMRENQALKHEMEELRRAYTDLHAAPPADTSYMQPETASPPAGTAPSTHEWPQPETPDQASHLYETIGQEQEQEQTLVCRHCQESFPFITRQELEQHEQSHRVCPFCTMICDNMEQSVFEDHVYSHEL
ncbi:Tax1-binding protein 1-like protein [Larimichthys crocea]|uniref:Tax1-binding protein 1-like protein n=1 Tax=Larimichthys crocea TaxID=215358 RepID=A0A6G0HXE8_LARCR|nr:Tax1-binding protein 1-like protein [Larimichthys crocea]